jgi:hypothetical protein
MKIKSESKEKEVKIKSEPKEKEVKLTIFRRFLLF